jgi:hypothetical protein
VDKELLSIPEPSINANPDSVRIVYRRDKNNWCGVAYTASDLDLSEWSNDEIGEGNVYTPHLIMAGGYPHVIFINYDPNYIISVLCHATVMAIPSDWAVTNILVDPNNRYNDSRIAVDPQGWLHVLWEEMTSGYIRVAHSTDGGSHWSGFNFIAYSNSSGSSLATSSQGILVVFDSLDNGVRHVYGRASNDFGVSWNNPFQITDFSGINESNCYLVSGHSARHLLFQRQDPTSDYDLYYMAYDDSLLSDSPEATAYNSASHLARDYFSGSLHLVYQSQDRLLYSYSNDGGMTWTPHHILEDPETQQKEHGRYPSIGLNPGFFACNPCVVFVDSDNQVKYLYRDLGGEWQGFTILPAIFGLDPGPPAIATYGGDVYVVFSVMSWVGREDFISAVLFYQFSSSATEPPDPTILDQAMNGSLYGSNVSITIDGNGAPHVAWSKKVGLNNYEDIFYCWRDANGNWQQIRNISEQSNAQSVCPHIDDYGDYLSAVWWYDGDYEIWLRQKYIPDDWEDKIPYSQEYAICNYPVNAAVDFSVWCETPSNQSDIRYHSTTTH